MPDHPFHVAGGVFLGHSPARPEINASFLTRPQAELPDLPEAASTSRRRKLWEIPHKFHCPVVGSCFAVKELRSLMHKVMHLPRDTSDFVLHTTAVGACENRSRLAELLHKTLEKRYALTIRRFAASKTADGVRQLWREATASGVELPGALWAAWTHPACDSLLEHEIYGDIHMIQHQVGTGARADLKTLQALRTENAELRRQVNVLRQDAEAARHEKAGETRALGERLTELRAEQAGRDACIARLSAELERLRDSVPELRQRQALARRAEDADARATALAAQCREQAETVDRLQRRLAELAPADNRQAEDTSLPDSTDETLRTGRLRIARRQVRALCRRPFRGGGRLPRGGRAPGRALPAPRRRPGRKPAPYRQRPRRSRPRHLPGGLHQPQRLLARERAMQAHRQALPVRQTQRRIEFWPGHRRPVRRGAGGGDHRLTISAAPLPRC